MTCARRRFRNILAFTIHMEPASKGVQIPTSRTDVCEAESNFQRCEAEENERTTETLEHKTSDMAWKYALVEGKIRRRELTSCDCCWTCEGLERNASTHGGQYFIHELLIERRIVPWPTTFDDRHIVKRTTSDNISQA